MLRKDIALERSLHQMGAAIRTARLRRRLPAALLAERAGISVITLRKLETGSPGVRIGNVVAVFMALGFGSPLEAITDPKADALGLQAEIERLPKRARITKQAQV